MAITMREPVPAVFFGGSAPIELLISLLDQMQKCISFLLDFYSRAIEM
ncbi:hypothetical protein NYE76_31950 [Paenibacillus sp. FSL M7-0831]|nr:hypothetical protein [Paenibacillus macerans]